MLPVAFFISYPGQSSLIQTILISFAPLREKTYFQNVFVISRTTEVA